METNKMKASVMLLFIIFLTLTTAHAGEWIVVDGGSIKIDLNEKKVEHSLWEFLATKKEYKFLPKENYTYQYQSNVKNGKEEVYINAFCKERKQLNLHKDFVVVLDGGSCYFHIKYNPEIGEFYNLSVNGEA